MSTDKFVLSYTHLKDRPKSDLALSMLQRIASLVKPIMRKHGWVLPVLSEFFPESPNLVGLNLNAGQKILLRLRPAWAQDTFYLEDDVVKVMLHELTHNVHGPHDQKFYKFLTELGAEYEALQRSGYSGEGFYSKGYRVGANVSHDPPLHFAKAKALEAAEKRKKIEGMLGGGGRLGVSGAARRGITPRELAAEAAERRIRDAKTCGSGELAQREADRASKDSIEVKAIDLTKEDVIILDQTTHKPYKSAIIQPNKAANLTISQRASSSNYSEALAAQSEWSCTACTLLNNPLTLQCAACLSIRPHNTSVEWTCFTCGEGGMSHEFFSCRFCGSVKTESVFG